MINETQAHMLASILHEIRPRWGVPAMVKVFEQHHAHPATFGDITLASVSAARDEKVTTPGAVFVDARFWPETVKALVPKPPACVDHPWLDGPSCRCCWADVKVGQREPSMVGKHSLLPGPVQS